MLIPADENGLITIRQPQEGSILVVEGEPIARISLTELLRDVGYLVFEAADSTSATDYIHAYRGLQVVLTDLSIPGWYSVIEHGRAVLPKAFFLCMVGEVSMPVIVKTQRLGACGCFLKPLNFAGLHRTIQNLLATPVTIK